MIQNFRLYGPLFGGGGGSSSPPAAPPPPPPPPLPPPPPDPAAAQQALDAEARRRKLAANAEGQQSTIGTTGAGATLQPGDVAKKTLLGS